MHRETNKNKWVVGITDKVVPPADIEQEAFPEAERIPVSTAGERLLLFF